MGNGKKLRRDIGNLGPSAAAGHAGFEQSTGPKGLYGQHFNEGDGVPEFKRAGGDVVQQGMNNSFIVQGRDRPGHSGEGEGAVGGTECGYIDLVAGLGGHDHSEYVKKIHKKEKRDLSQKEKERDPNFFLDAARVYITQRGDIDYYMGLAHGSERLAQSQFKSAVGIKADHVRLVAREHLKFVVGKARLENAGMMGEKNSQGGEMAYVGKIDFIAGNYTDDEEGSLLSFFSNIMGNEPIPKLQPLVKGANMIKCLNYMFNQMNEFVQCFLEIEKVLVQLMTAIAAHTHPVAGAGVGVATPGTGAALQLAAYKDIATVLTRITSSNFNLGAQLFNFISSKNTANFICSRHVHTT